MAGLLVDLRNPLIRTEKNPLHKEQEMDGVDEVTRSSFNQLSLRITFITHINNQLT